MEFNNPIYSTERRNGLQRNLFKHSDEARHLHQRNHLGDNNEPVEEEKTVSNVLPLQFFWNKDKWIHQTFFSLVSRLTKFLQYLVTYSSELAWNNLKRRQRDPNTTQIEYSESQELILRERLVISDNKATNDDSVAAVSRIMSPADGIDAILCPPDNIDSDDEIDDENGNQQYGTTFDLIRTGIRVQQEFVESRRYLTSGFEVPALANSTSSLSSSTSSSFSVAPGSPASTSNGADSNMFDLLQTSPSSYNAAVARFYLPRIPISTPQYSLVDSLITNLQKQQTPTDWLDDKQKIVTKERTTVEPAAIKKLTTDQQQKVNKIWSSSNASTIVSSLFQIDITVRDMQTLCDGQWLNDNIIDFYLNLLTSKNPDSIFCWTTHFFTTLQTKGYSGVARWSKRKKLNVAEKELIIVPINIMGTHWALAVVNNKLKSFQYYDSLSLLGNKKAL